MIQLTTKAEEQIRVMHRCLTGQLTHPKVEVTTTGNGCKVATAKIDRVDEPVRLLTQNMNTKSVYAAAAKQGMHISWLMGTRGYLGPVVWGTGDEIGIGSKEQLAHHIQTQERFP